MGVDLGIIFFYLAATIALGLKFSGARDLNDYFLGSRSVNWVLACFSIVATETSSLSFLSIPGVAYVSGMDFLQISFGYLLGRVLVALILLPRYYEGNLQTVYEYIQTKFNTLARKIIALLFHVTRVLADAVRLFATAIPLTVLMGWDFRISLLIIGGATFIYTFYGGIRSVIVVDALQFFIYLGCVVLGIAIIFHALPFGELMGRLNPGDFRVFYWGTEAGRGGVAGSYNVISCLVGGAFLSFASHGTDHIIVQRVLSCRDLGAARKAMVASGVIIIIQFFLFLFFGVLIRAFFSSMSFGSSDEVVPYFIIHHLPTGLRGLVLAGIFASAMSTLSSSINSLSSSTAFDMLNLQHRNITEKKKVGYSRIITLVWTVTLVGASILFNNAGKPLVVMGLSIASVTYGGIMGIFILGYRFSHVGSTAALAGVVIAIAAVSGIAVSGGVFWLWYTGIGFAVTVVTALAVQRLLGKRGGQLPEGGTAG
ncbi:MAG TPA: sodium:solute symporter [Spirochaetes bacterium]|nr:sodium:solute symporter [Spirochaetota bacterium]